MYTCNTGTFGHLHERIFVSKSWTRDMLKVVPHIRSPIKICEAEFGMHANVAGLIATSFEKWWLYLFERTDKFRIRTCLQQQLWSMEPQLLSLRRAASRWQSFISVIHECRSSLNAPQEGTRVETVRTWLKANELAPQIEFFLIFGPRSLSWFQPSKTNSNHTNSSDRMHIVWCMLDIAQVAVTHSVSLHTVLWLSLQEHNCINLIKYHTLDHNYMYFNDLSGRLYTMYVCLWVSMSERAWKTKRW